MQTLKNVYNKLVKRLFDGELATNVYQNKRPLIRGRAAGAALLGLKSGGSFIDGSIYKRFSCPNDDYDPCANGDAACGASYQPAPYADSDYVSKGSTAQSSGATKTSSKTSTNKPTPTPTPKPSPTSKDPPKPTSTPPTYTDGGTTYPGQFEVFFYTSNQPGPNGKPIKTNTGLAGFERPQGNGWKICHSSGITEVSQKEVFAGSATNPRMPAKIDVLHVFGDTCSYAETQDEYGAKEGDVVGTLKCPFRGDATCVKNTKETGGCAFVVFTSLVLCSWN